jgi:hypothetical protein
MDAEPALSNYLADFFEPILGRIVDLVRTTSPKSRTDDCEHRRNAQGFIISVERAIDKNVPPKPRHLGAFFRGYFANR